MDNQLKEAITLARAGEREAAQKQLTSFLDEKPEEAQGWYLLSLLVESPQKQAAYLSKTLAINPNHSKAKAQLETLQGAAALAPTSSISSDFGERTDLLEQAEEDALPDWLQQEQDVDALPTLEKVEDISDTAVPNETLPDWLKEPAAIPEEPLLKPVEESPTVVGQTAQSSHESDKTVDLLRQQAADKAKVDQQTKKQAKSKPSTSKSSSGLNIVLAILIILAVVVVAMLAFLIFS
ncbi:MAG: hypothetical protein DHS20C20_06750 [Ardenticatenaceae bacterium]|nr:MAG: hypothetical protein DHS20C20_06750 [Ardenticatenaceae bacterium]